MNLCIVSMVSIADEFCELHGARMPAHQSSSAHLVIMTNHNDKHNYQHAAWSDDFYRKCVSHVLDFWCPGALFHPYPTHPCALRYLPQYLTDVAPCIKQVRYPQVSSGTLRCKAHMVRQTLGP